MRYFRIMTVTVRRRDIYDNYRSSLAVDSSKRARSVASMPRDTAPPPPPLPDPPNKEAFSASDTCTFAVVKNVTLSKQMTSQIMWVFELDTALRCEQE